MSGKQVRVEITKDQYEALLIKRDPHVKLERVEKFYATVGVEPDKPDGKVVTGDYIREGKYQRNKTARVVVVDRERVEQIMDRNIRAVGKSAVAIIGYHNWIYSSDLSRKLAADSAVPYTTTSECSRVVTTLINRGVLGFIPS